MSYVYRSSVRTPKPVTSLTFASRDVLSVGSDDGSVRVYNLPATTVVRAIRGIGSGDVSEISSIAWTTPPLNDQGEVWIACGNKVSQPWSELSLHKKLILTSEDASSTFVVGEDAEQEINELCISDSKQSLSFGTDSGSVCVLDLKMQACTTMRTRHSSICSSARFIPDRPSELVSGGYDSAILHFDYKQGSLISRYDIVASPPESGSMAMPFVISLAMSSAGVLAATLADGRVWISAGGAKLPHPKAKTKRSRKWEGLRDSLACYKQIATGPVIASAFTSDGTHLVTCTLLGKLAKHKIVYDAERIAVETIWNDEVKSLQKVSAIALGENWFAVGGFGQDEKGIVELWSPSSDASSNPATPPEHLKASSSQT